MLTHLARWMRRQRYQDPETGLYNQDLLRRCWSRLVRRARRTSSPMAVVTVTIEMVDGSRLEEDALCRVAAALQRCNEARDIAFRTGPARFTVLAPDVALARAGEMSERLRRSARRSLPREVVERARVRTWLSVVGSLHPRAA